MIKELSKLEFSILERLAIEYPFVKDHIPLLRVASRENTGVGMYINLVYCDTVDEFLSIEMPNQSISTNERIEIAGLRFGLCYEVNLKEGKIDFIELVTYGEDWDGIVPEDFDFVV